LALRQARAVSACHKSRQFPQVARRYQMAWFNGAAHARPLALLYSNSIVLAPAVAAPPHQHLRGRSADCAREEGLLVSCSESTLVTNQPVQNETVGGAEPFAGGAGAGQARRGGRQIGHFGAATPAPATAGARSGHVAASLGRPPVVPPLPPCRHCHCRLTLSLPSPHLCCRSLLQRCSRCRQRRLSGSSRTPRTSG